MHRGCFMWTPTPPLAGRRTPRPGPVRVCVCSSFLAGSGGPASRARSGAPHLFLWLLCLSALLGPLRAGVAPVLVLCLPSPPPFCFCFVVFFFICPFPFALRPLCLLLFLVSGPGCSGPWRFALFVLLASRFLALRPLSLSLCCPAVGRSPVVAAPPPPSLAVVAVSRCLALVFFCSLFLLSPAPPLSPAFCVFRPRVPWALALVCVCCARLSVLCVLFFFLPPASSSFVRSCLFCVSWLAGGFSPVVVAPPPPSPLVSRGFRRSRSAPWFFFFAPLLCAPVVSCFLSFAARGAVGLGGVFCLFFSASRCPALRALPPHVCLPVGRWLLPGGCRHPPPLPLCVSRFSSLLLGALVFFFLPLCAPVVSGFLWFPAPGALVLGAVRC